MLFGHQLDLIPSASWQTKAKIVICRFIGNAAFRPAIEFLRRPAVGNILDNLQPRWLDG